MQRSRLLLLAASSLLLCPPGLTQDPVPAFCDHKDVEAAVDLALVTHNAKLQQGHQLALYQIVGASKAENESTTLFNLKFLVRESDCPVGGDKVWRDCDYLPQGNRSPSPCTAVVSKSNEDEGLRIVLLECKPTVEPVVVASEAQCLGCPEEIDVDSEDLKEPVSYSLAKFNAEDGSSHHFLLREIVSARRQVVAGFKYDIQFDLEKSNCSKEDFKELTEECHPGSESFASCNSTVYIAPWRREEPEAHVSCEHGPLRMRLAMRRPPGWSPLRHYTSFAAKAEKSSEESQEEGPPPPATPPPALPPPDTPPPALPPPGTPPPAPESTPDPALLLPLPPQSEPPRPFNCPTKPWKEFVPLILTPPPPPPPPPQSEDTPAPELKLEDGLFSDLDLVG